jgi:hypothetical protein|tara:strand:+ start:446 stop:1087 length:642 start_codon:yes stop_codon:yes gene_type:complete
MRTIFEYDGLSTSQPFTAGGSATTKTITAQQPAGYTDNNANLLRFYANDGVAGKNVSGSRYIQAPSEPKVRLTARFSTPNAEADWNFWWLLLYLYDGTNRNSVGINWNSAYGVTKAVESFNTGGGQTAIASAIWTPAQNRQTEIDLVATWNASGVDPSYDYLRINEWETTTFAADGQSTAGADTKQLFLTHYWSVDDGATRYMYLNQMKVQVF